MYYKNGKLIISYAAVLVQRIADVVLLHVVGPGPDLEHVVLEVASGLGNVGLTAGISGPELHWLGKLGLTVIMWMGRLEIVPILVLFAALVTGRHRRRQNN